MAEPQWQGMAALRQTLADQLALSRGLRCDAGQIVIVSGTRQAADLLARLLVNPGEPVWLEAWDLREPEAAAVRK